MILISDSFPTMYTDRKPNRTLIEIKAINDDFAMLQLKYQFISKTNPTTDASIYRLGVLENPIIAR